MGLLSPKSIEFLRLKTVELFSSNVPSAIPSFSDMGKSFTFSALVLFLVSGVEWILVQYASFPGLGWCSVAASALALAIHQLVLFLQHGSPAKVAEIKQEIKALKSSDDPPPDDPDAPGPPLRMSA